MKFTPGQVQSLLGLSPEAFRHWRKMLPPVAGRNGYRPCFSRGDLLAMAFIKAIADDAGVPVRTLHAISGTLFERCSHQSWDSLGQSILIIELARVRAEFAAESQAPRFNGIGIVVPCGPIVTDLRERLLTDEEDVVQGNLHLSPSSV